MARWRRCFILDACIPTLKAYDKAVTWYGKAAITGRYRAIMALGETIDRFHVEENLRSKYDNGNGD